MLDDLEAAERTHKETSIGIWSGLMTSLSTIVNTGITGMKAALDGLAAEAKSVIADVASKISSAWDSVKDFAGKVADKIDSVLDSARAAYQRAKDLLAKATSKKEKAKETEKEAEKAEPVPPRGGGGAVRRQFGGKDIVRRPTWFLAGEAGPELHEWTPLSKIDSSRDQGGRKLVINGPLVVIEGSADPKTARLAADLIMQELRKIA